VYAPCDVGSNENGIEIATGKAGQNIKWQIKRLCLSMMLYVV
jgi:hypothetical protein